MFVPLSILEFRDRAERSSATRSGSSTRTRVHLPPVRDADPRLANALVGLGVGAGDRVSFVTFSTHHLLPGLLQGDRAAQMLNPVNIRLAPHEIAHGSSTMRPQRSSSSTAVAPLIEAIRPQLATLIFVILDGGAVGSPTTAEGPCSRAGRPAASRSSTRTRWPSCFLHERHDRPPEGRHDDPSGAVPAMAAQIGWPSPRRMSSSMSFRCSM